MRDCFSILEILKKKTTMNYILCDESPPPTPPARDTRTLHKFQFSPPPVINSVVPIMTLLKQKGRDADTQTNNVAQAEVQIKRSLGDPPPLTVATVHSFWDVDAIPHHYMCVLRDYGRGRISDAEITSLLREYAGREDELLMIIVNWSIDRTTGPLPPPAPRLHTPPRICDTFNLVS